VHETASHAPATGTSSGEDKGTALTIIRRHVSLLRREASTRTCCRLAELLLAKQRGELVELAAVERHWATIWRTVRDLLRMVPMSVVDQAMAAAADGRVALKICLQEAIDDALRRAATTDIKLEDQDDDEEQAV
jgi:hypothetical protein